MRRWIIVSLIVTAVGAGAYYMLGARASDAIEQASGARGGGDMRGPAAGRTMRTPMTVEVGVVSRADLAQRITVVGNLIGRATVTAVPKVNGRLESVGVRLGDRVSRGQRLAKIEDREILEQVKQAEASFEVGAATIRQREADLRFAETNLTRSRNLFERELIPRQTLDDAEARYQAGSAQLDLAQAQYAQAQARLDELRINLANTIITSPVDGFVGSRTLDPGAWVTPNSEFLSLVDISVVRIVTNVVERDLRRISVGRPADVEVDAYPGEMFTGHVTHVAPVLDPTTRTAQAEIEIDNSKFRLKPGMYARVSFTVDQRENALVIPTTALVDVEGARGVFLPHNDAAAFRPITVGLIDQTSAEVVDGLDEGQRVITTGAAALRDGDPIVIASQGGNGANDQADESDGTEAGSAGLPAAASRPPHGS